MQKIIIFNEIKNLHKFCAEQFIEQVKNNPYSKIGFATGVTPVPTYKLIIEDHKKNGTSWANVTGFNLDEFVGIDPKHNESFKKQMMMNLYDHININKQNIYIPDCKTINPFEEAKKYEKKIRQKGPIDFQYVSIGINGHIAYNEPGTSFDSLTHVTNLSKDTIIDMIKKQKFKNKNEVPKQAITMGIKTILETTKKVMMVVYGAHKAKVVKMMIESKPNTSVTASALQNHSNCFYVLDKNAASKLSIAILKNAKYK